MSRFKKNGLAFAAILGASLTGAPVVAADSIGALRGDEAGKFNACLGMPQAQREADEGCLTLMLKTKIPKADMEKMHDCENIQGTVDKVPECQAMIKKHPQMVRGHGESMSSSTSGDTPGK